MISPATATECLEPRPSRRFAQDFDGLTAQVSALLDKAEITQALEAIWAERAAPEPYVEERAPWKLAMDPDAARELDVTLRSLAEGLRGRHRAAAPVHAADDRAAAGTALGRDRFAIAAPLRARPRRHASTTLDPPLFPKPQ
jgi:methionyl-tRNA synthetase